jgi:hypothetical protein
MFRTCVIQLTQGSAPRQRVFMLSAGNLTKLDFDPNRYRWRGKGLLLTYTAQLGRTLLHNCSQFSKIIGQK